MTAAIPPNNGKAASAIANRFHQTLSAGQKLMKPCETVIAR